VLRFFVSPRSEERLSAAEAFLGEGTRDAVALIVGPSRGAALDLAARVGSKRGAIFGLHRMTLGQLASRLAAPELARRRLAPATSLGVEAVVARAVASALEAGSLGYFAPVARTPSFARTLARALEELRLEAIGHEEIRGDTPRSRDLRELVRRYDEERERARIADRAEVLDAARRAVNTSGEIRGARLVLLDVPIASRLEERFAVELARAAEVSFATVPAGDERAVEAIGSIADEVVTDASERSPTSLSRLHRYLFAAKELPVAEAGDDVSFFSAPGEGRECVEIARRILSEVRRGVRFDDIAVFLRAPDTYAALLESALRRAKIPAHFAFGAARPEPSGRAFLALLACRAEDLSPRRFAEYLSLTSLPEQPPWERLLVEASIVGRKERWTERLSALARSFERELALLRRRDPGSPRVESVEREIAALAELTRFALPIIDALAELPERASWGAWIEALGGVAKMALDVPERPQASSYVLAALSELAPMADVPAVSFDEVRRVLEGRLGAEVTPPSGRRYGAVFVGTPELARGRSFAVVFVPGLAERLFPEAPREDPILLDADRRAIARTLETQADRSRNERLLLRLSVGAARERVHLSYPRVEVAAARPRVPSFYGLDVRRATTGTLPDHDALEREAASASGARLAWPAPLRAEDAIDDAEHDLSTLGRLLHGADEKDVAGRAQYLLDLNPHLARSLRARSARWDKPWSHHDGVVRKTVATAPLLASSRLRVRSYAVTAIEKFAACPYRFLLAAIHRLPARERRGTPDRLDPIARGVLFHRVQAETLSVLEREGALPFGPEGLPRAKAALDGRLDAAAREHEERTLPPVESVFRDEIERARRELHAWLERVAEQSWLVWPVRYDLSFGLPPHEHEDPRSVAEPAILEGDFRLHGAIDLVERHATTGHARVTDAKTGANFTKPGLVIGGGEVLQPVLYGLAYEAVWKEPVTDACLSFCTARGGYVDHVIELDDAARSKARVVLSLVDDAIDKGFFPPAPREGACDTCGFRIVCGPHEPRRAARKDHTSLDGGELFARLSALREEP